MSAGNSGIKVVPRSFALCGKGLFLLEVINLLSKVDFISLIFIIIGSIIVYGASYILKIFKCEKDDIKIIILKLVGLIIACFGFFRVLNII